MHNLAMHIGESIVAALEAIDQTFMIQAQAMQHGCLQVVHVAWVLSDVVAEVVGGAIRQPFLVLLSEVIDVD